MDQKVTPLESQLQTMQHRAESSSDIVRNVVNNTSLGVERVEGQLQLIRNHAESSRSSTESGFHRTEQRLEQLDVRSAAMADELTAASEIVKATHGRVETLRHEVSSV